MAKLANLPWLAEVVFAIARSALHFFVWTMANHALTMATVAEEIVKEHSAEESSWPLFLSRPINSSQQTPISQVNQPVNQPVYGREL